MLPCGSLTRLDSLVPSHPHRTAPGHLIFWGGITTGLCNLIGGAAVGITGANAAVADAADGQLFIKILVVEIFSSIIPMFGLITALLLVSSAA